jgi:pyrimidine 5'-nucleotidase
MFYSTLFIDLDETVYPTSSGVWDAISERMEQYMHDRLDIPRAEIPAMRKELFLQYGTTLRGLQATRQVDELEFIAYVHDVPLDRLLRPDPGLRQALLRYPQPKLVFTNADRNHASRVIRQVELEGCFAGIVDILDLSPYCKPMPESFEIAMRLAGETDPGRCVLVDDSPRNLAAGRALGFFTVQVSEPKPGFPHPPSPAHACIERLRELPAVLDPLRFGRPAIQ